LTITIYPELRQTATISINGLACTIVIFLVWSIPKIYDNKLE